MHPVLELLATRARRGARADGATLALVIEGGGMRGVVSSAMAAAIEARGLTPCFDLVAGTPPYLHPGSATPPSRVQCGPCHLEIRGGIEDYCVAAARWMAPGGRFVVCQAAAQVERVLAAAEAAGLGVDARLDVVPREGKAALFSVYGMRRAGERGATAVHPPLVVRDRAGRRTDAFQALRREMGMPP